MLAMRSIALLGIFLFNPCDPQGPGDPSDSNGGSGTDGDTLGGGGSSGSGGDNTDTGGGWPMTSSASTDPDATTTGFSHPDTDTGGPPAPLDCPGARFVHQSDQGGVTQAMAVDSRGHVLLLVGDEVRDIDATGTLVNTTVVGDDTVAIYWGGVDAADNWYVRVHTLVAATNAVRKYDVGGALVWQSDLPAPPDETSSIQSFAVGPDGTSVAGEWHHDFVDELLKSRLFRLDSAGALVSDVELTGLLKVRAIDAAGKMAVTRNGAGGAMQVLAADGSTVWSTPHPVNGDGWAGLKASGEVTIGALVGNNKLRAARFDATGAVVWNNLPNPLGLNYEVFDTFAVNAAGVSAFSSHVEDIDGTVYVARIDDTGAIAGVHSCTRNFGETFAAIDASGDVYLAGTHYLDVEGPGLPFVVAFD